MAIGTRQLWPMPFAESMANWNSPRHLASRTTHTNPTGGTLFHRLQATEVLLRDEIIGVEPKRGFEINLRVRQPSLGETDPTQAAKGLMVVWIEANHRLEFMIRVVQMVLQNVNIPELVVTFVVIGLDPDC